MSLCKYANLIGEPGTGIHSVRLFNIAIIDVIVTVIGAWFLSKYLKKSFQKTTIILFVLGIISHRIFCVKSTVDKLLFGD